MTAWKKLKLPECLDKNPRISKIPRRKFLSAGRYPIVSQEKDLINGYWDEKDDVVPVEPPVVVFGDHTQALKLIDFNFVVGADGVKVLKPKGFLDARYLYYFLKGHPLKELGYARHYRLLKELDIEFPPLPQQKRIVTILDEAFAGIDTAIANTEKNLANARELFESYLDTVFSRRGEGWSSHMLKEVGRVQTGSTPKTSEKGNYGNYIPFIKPGDFQPDGTVDYSNEGLSPDGAKKARAVQAYSVLMVCIGATIGKTGFVEKAVTTNQQINAFIPHDGCSYKFAYYQMLSTAFQRQVLARAGQATLPIISKAKWGELPLWFPVNEAEQERIVAKLDELAAARREVQSVYERKLMALAELKQSLLQKAFSGELTAGTAEKNVDEAVA